MSIPFRQVLRAHLSGMLGMLTLLILFGTAAVAQTGSLALSSASANAGTSVPLTLTLTSPSGNQPSGVQWNLTYSTASIASVTITAGSATTAAGKTLYCSGSNGSYNCLIVGSNATVIQNGAVAVVTATLTATAVGSIPLNISNTVATSPAGTSLSMTGTGGTITVNSSVVVSSLSCSPTALASSAASTCTVSLSQGAPSGGAVVSLSSNNGSLSVPSSVTVTAGATSASFTATAGTITSNQSATVSAVYNGTSRSATLSLTAPVVITSLACTPTTLSSGQSSTCTVTLSAGAPAGGAAVSVSSNNGALTVPASITVGAGATSGTFSATAGTISSNQSAIVTATYGSSSQTATWSLTVPTVISSLSCTPLTLGSGATSTCTVTLSAAAPAGGAVITLSSNNPTLTVPASATVAAGATTQTFTSSAPTVSSNQTATVTASYGSSSQTATFSLVTQIVVSSLSCVPANLGSNGSSTCTVTLSTVAPSGGVVVSLANNNSVLTIPASATIAAGASTATFTATSGTVSVASTATLTASYNAGSQTATISLGPTLVSSLACTPASLSSGASSTCTVTLTTAAPSGGAVVTLSSNNGALTVLGSVTVAAQAATATFSATAGTISSAQNATVTASYNSSSQNASIALAPTVISRLTCDHTSLGSNSTAQCTATLSGPAPAGGAIIALSSTATALSVPGSLVISSGTSAGTFTVSSGVVTGSQTATVTATYGSSSQIASISLAPTVISSLTCAPLTLSTGGTSSCTVTLSAAAPTGGASVALSSNLSALSVPPSVIIPAGSVSTNFSATAGTITSSQTATVSAAYNGSTASAVFSLGPVVVSFLTCNPLNLGTGAVSNCTVGLSGPAPASGATVTLASDSGTLTVPSSVTLAAGASSGSFTATAGTVVGSQTANVTATYNGSSQTAAFSLGPSLVSAATCSPTSLSAGETATCTVKISAPAPAGGSTVNLASNNPALSIPSTLSVPAGSFAGTFTATAGSVNVTQNAIITVSAGNSVQTVNLTLIGVPPVVTQSFNNSALSGAYFFRQVSLGTDGTANLTGPRSLQGSITFDGTGNYTFSAQVMQNSGSSPLSGSGTYTVDTAGTVSLDSPLQSGDKVNARLGPEALMGSSTESSGTAYGLFVAIPAPTTPTSTSSLNGSYWIATLEFPNASLTDTRSTMSLISSSGTGALPNFNVTGHAADSVSGQMQTQALAGATYTLGSDGSGTISFGAVSSLLNGTKTFYISQDGSILLGGTPNRDSYDIMIGVKAGSNLSNASWSGAFWAAGLRGDTTAVAGFAGSTVASGDGRLYWTRRLKQQGSANVDYTAVTPYSLNTDGSGTANTDQVAVAADGSAFLGMSGDSSAYAIYFGSRMPAVSGSGLFVNPQGIQNAGSYAPTGNPIAPGELIYLYVSGLSVASQTATPPYPLSLGGVTVLINSNPAPLYLVSPTELVVVVPYATTGPIASVVVQANGLTSNVANVPVAATAPGVFSQTENGSGLGAIRHADYSAVTSSNPAHSGEVVLIYLTGLGVVTPPLADGVGGPASPLSVSVVTPTVLVGGQLATVQFSGMSSYPGLYQINAQLPAIPLGATTLPLVIQTPNAYHSQVSIAVAP